MNLPAACLQEFSSDYNSGFVEDLPPAPADSLTHSALAEYKANLALRHTPRLGARSICKLLRNFGSARRACEEVAQWRSLGILPNCQTAFQNNEWKDAATAEWQKALKTSAAILLWQSSDYPTWLRQLPDAPAILYCKGNMELLSAPAIAIVGSRNPTRHSEAVAESFGQSLSKCGLTVVSGMAMGIDRFAHAGALAGVGKSIGVLGTGIDIDYPRSNADIFEKMRAQGLLISEFSPGAAPAAANFPIRNRIISGLSLGVLVVEAATRSGSLITARLALEQNREVFAVPGGALSATSLGCQNLVRQGARAVFCVDDILRDLEGVLHSYNLPPIKPQDGQTINDAPPSCAADEHFDLPAQFLSNPDEPASDIDPQITNSLLGKNAGRILELLNKGPRHSDELLKLSPLSPRDLNVALLGLEMQGQIARLPGSRYKKVC